jgi:thymidylate synthase ThyX
MKVVLDAYTKPAIQGVSTQEYPSFITNANKDKRNRMRRDRERIQEQELSFLEHCTCTFRIETSRIVARELRLLNFIIYDRPDLKIIFEDLELRENGKTVDSHDRRYDAINKISEHIGDIYAYLIDSGIDEECADAILPGYFQTTIIVTGTLKDWKLFTSRLTTYTKELQDIGKIIESKLIQLHPNIFLYV